MCISQILLRKKSNPVFNKQDLICAAMALFSHLLDFLQPEFFNTPRLSKGELFFVSARWLQLRKVATIA